MLRLLTTEHGDIWTRAELERHVAGNMLDVSDALIELHRCGLLHVEGELVTVSRTARRMDEISQLDW
jgi:DNA-binding response OmpR family regulator